MCKSPALLLALILLSSSCAPSSEPPATNDVEPDLAPPVVDSLPAAVEVPAPIYADSAAGGVPSDSLPSDSLPADRPSGSGTRPRPKG